VRADIRVMLSIVNQNLSIPTPPEFADANRTVIRTFVPRSARVHMAWSY
jgi:hypothetical protein